MFRINHLILGTTDLKSSESFYVELFGFQRLCTFTDTGTGKEGSIFRLVDETQGAFELLLVPFTPERLPSPQHIAFEVDTKRFEALYARAKELGLPIRGMPALASPEAPPGTLELDGFSYRNFYVLDPMRINIEVMVRT